MYIEQLYTNCLAEAAYYIESNGQAAIIDPLRETTPYLELAQARGTKIKYIFETHFHADFVSGHLDLAERTGATIVFGPQAETAYEIEQAKDGQEFQVGNVTLRVLHTPGHTPESSCYLLLDEQNREHALFSGDTLFIGDVGRPDLAQKTGEITPEDMAGQLYDSLREKINPLPDNVIVYPAHGAGSACGKKMSDERFALLGDQKKTNYALGDISREDFIKELTTGIAPPPQYFAKAAVQNKTGYKSIEELLEDSSKALSVDRVAFLQEEGALIIDTRQKDDFREAHIPGAWFIGLNGQFAPWAGALISNMSQQIVIVADEGMEEEAITRLARVGFDNVLGFLEGGMKGWTNNGRETRSVTSISPEDFNPEGTTIIDVRKPSEYDDSHISTAVNKPLDFFSTSASTFSTEGVYSIHCKSGYRSMIAASVLLSQGIENVIDIRGGFDALSQQNLALEGATLV